MKVGDLVRHSLFKRRIGVIRDENLACRAYKVLWLHSNSDEWISIFYVDKVKHEDR